MVGEDLAVPHDHDERLQDLTELLAQIGLDIEVAVGRQRGAEIGGHECREPPWRSRRHRPGDPVRHPQEDPALGGEHEGEERDQAQPDPPVQTAVPAELRHRQPCTRPPTR